MGVGWNGLLKIVTIVVAAAKIFVLARLLSPRDFGLFSLVAIALGLMESMTETGINTTIVQSSKRVTYFLDTAWVISILRGLLISIFMLFLGLIMQQIYQEPNLLFLIAVAAFIPLVRGFINPAVVKLHKDLQFFRDTLYRFSLIVVDFFAAIAWALIFPSPLAFIFAMLTAAFFEVFVTFVFFSERPTFSFLPSRAQEILHNAKGLSLSAVLNYAVQNVDNLILGKVVGTTSLGLYANGFNLSHKTNVELAKSVQHGIFPVYVRIMGDTARLKRAFIRSTLISFAAFSVIAIPFLLFPNTMVQVLFGPKWKGVEVILPWLIIGGLLQSLAILSFPLLIAKRQYTWINSHLFVQIVLLIGGLLIMAPRWGLLGGVLAVVLARLISLPITLYGAWQTLKTPHYR